MNDRQNKNLVGIGLILSIIGLFIAFVFNSQVGLLFTGFLGVISAINFTVADSKLSDEE